MREYLKELRQKKSLSQQAVADKIGVVQSYYTMIETGERQKDMSLSVMEKLSQVFGVTIDYIISQETKLKNDQRDSA